MSEQEILDKLSDLESSSFDPDSMEEASKAHFNLRRIQKSVDNLQLDVATDEAIRDRINGVSTKMLKEVFNVEA